jgi:hypothetical protein
MHCTALPCPALPCPALPCSPRLALPVSSVRPHATNRLALDGFSSNFLFENLFFSKICQEDSGFIKIGQKVPYMKTNINCLSYLAQFFLE